MTGFLDVRAVSRAFGGLRALDDLSLALAAGELLAIIGPNGCGKTTLFNVISGALRPDAGRIRFDGRDITGLAPFRVARLGIGRKFQIPGLFAELSVAENMTVPLFAGLGRRGLRGLPGHRRRMADPAPILELIGLADAADVRAGDLSHGQKQWLEIGMLLATEPRLMLLDEPTAGMTVGETEATAALIRRIRARSGTAVMVIEHDMGFVERLDCPVIVMMRGTVLRRGPLAEVRDDPEVREVYLGRGA